jgi:hypothetical protein
MRKIQKKLKTNEIEIPANIFQSIDLPPQVFPLLYSLGIDKTFQINGLVQKLVKLMSDNGVIWYMQKNNHSIFLLQVPSIQCTSRFQIEFLKGIYFLESAV